MKTSTKRIAVCAAVFVLIGVGLAVNAGTGTLSAIGYGDIALLCPLGALESMLGGWAVIPRALIALLVVVLVVFVFGRAFCAWVCPVPHVWNLFRTKKRREEEERTRNENAKMSLDRYRAGERPRRRFSIDPRFGVLAGALVSTAAVGFPVFCLVCPVGLICAIFLALWHMFAWGQVTWSLVVFPAILVLEVVFLRRWCHRFCPLGALMSLIASRSPAFRPVLDARACRRGQGVPCKACSSECPELIDPHGDLGMRPLSECTKCAQCIESCPAHALSFSIFPRSMRCSKDEGQGQDRD